MNSDLLKSETVYTPSALLTLYAADLRCAFDSQLIVLRGIYQRRYNNKEYNGYHYDQLLSETDQKHVRIKVHHHLRAQLTDGHLCILRGYLERKSGFSSVEILFVSDELLKKDQPAITETDMERARLLRLKNQRGNRNAELFVKQCVYQGRKIRIVNIYGNEAIVDKDFHKALGGACIHFMIKEKRCGMNLASGIAAAIAASDECDLLALVRGGGDISGMSVFNDPVIGGQMLSCEAIVATALGHTADESLADKIADHKFDLPFDYGATLARWVNEADEERLRTRQMLIAQTRKETEEAFASQVALLNSQLTARQQELERSQNKFGETINILQQQHVSQIAERETKHEAERVQFKIQMERAHEMLIASQLNASAVLHELNDLKLKSESYKRKVRNIVLIVITLAAASAFLLHVIP